MKRGPARIALLLRCEGLDIEVPGLPEVEGGRGLFFGAKKR